MSLERKDIKPRFYPEDHERIRIHSERAGMGMGEWIEQVVLRELDRLYAEAVEASSLLKQLDAVGVPGKNREKPGIPGNDPDGQGGRR